MVGASKILTVSYGTFSCTLEGFDEPFTTMKAIAEYFRDLAADDRYFGAEPPQPDAEMLHRIAEREIQRRVEAKIQANGVVLRPQIEEAAPEPVAHPAPAAAAPAPEPVTQPAPAPQPAVAEDSVAAKLQRIRAAVASARTAAVQPDALAEEAEIAPDPAAETSFAESEDFGYQLDISGPVEAAEVNAEPEVVAEQEPAPTPTFAADPDAAARRRASRRAARAAVLAQTAAELTAPVAPEPVLPVEDELDEITPVSELTAMLQAESAAVEDAPAPAIQEEQEEEEPLVLQTPVGPLRRVLVDEAPAAETEAEDDLLAELRALRNQSETVEETAEMIEPLPEPEIEPVPFDLVEDEIAVEVVAEAVAGIEPVEEFAVPEPVEAPVEFEPAEDTAELEAPVEPVFEPELPAAEEPRGLDHAAMSAEHDADVSRLMEKADEQLAGRENRRRFSAIAHLKAAVAATVADRRSKTAPKAEDQTGPYRADLSEAVRPRRPLQAEPSTPRPELSEARPAPLVLVSAQRIDRDSETVPPTAPVVRPRRIPSRLVANISPEDELVEFAEADLPPMAPSEAASFAEFAEARGAQGLTELLEAAAAYTAQVEGRPHFSPPQVMRKIASVSECAETSREERLRGFGALLRQGKIEKVRRGQYAIAKASRYYDESKSA
ncbi:hypothetical protein LZA78_14240 [Sinirhodobacter sp. WL0062]|uniref:Lipoprotein n=1 Tax=Rhodobacter flavimaris TaxID=2907145 RepID=A0ABS8Z3Y1_9RHOB|nr:hypothetical protein [Sinirhodobacter sp. WL0062]MCE5974645.1 hypothetical protein [Sinirhodobacter sp. WL0062]